MPQRDDELLARKTVIDLMKAADAARRAMTRALEPFELTLPQFNVLTILLHHDELPTFQIAFRMVENTPGITRLVSTLVAKRYVRRYQSTTDRRQQLCALTAAGRRVVKSAIPGFSVVQQLLIAALDRSEAQQLSVLLQQITFPRDAAVRGRSRARSGDAPGRVPAPASSPGRSRQRRPA